MLSVQEDGLEILIPELLDMLDDEKPASTRAGAADLLAAFCGSSKCDFEGYVGQLITALLGLFCDKDQIVLAAAW